VNFWAKQSKAKDDVAGEVSTARSYTDSSLLPTPSPPFPRPQIALFDLEEPTKELLSQSRLAWESATLGSCIRVPNDRSHQYHLLHIDSSWPSNLHEFDICILDLTKERMIDFSSALHRTEKNTNIKSYAMMCAFPQKIFDSRPFAAIQLSREIDQLLSKDTVLIIFCGENATNHYQVAETTSHGTHVESEFDASLFSIYRNFPRSNSKSGRKIELAPGHIKLAPLLAKHLDGSRYETVFEHPTIYKNGKDIKSSNFLPLLVNNSGEIVGYLHSVNKGTLIVLPELIEKSRFIDELCSIYLPEMFPALFPSHGQFMWLKEADYQLPGMSELEQLKIDRQAEYSRQISAINKNIEENKKAHQFLHDILFETGDALVRAVETYMGWLNFDNIKNMDEGSPQIREEDLQIETQNGLLILEIKGLGGTSTDKDCAQVSKIRFRRAEERQKFDVFGLYIVNHQRYLPPKIRKNPPFTDHQLNDALLEKRGLLTTYSLYQAYFLVQCAILTKDQIKDKLFNFGLISFDQQHLASIGVPLEILKQGSVAIYTLDGTVTLTKGCTLIAKKNNDVRKVTVLSIHLDNAEVQTANSGEVGILLSAPIKKGTELFLLEPLNPITAFDNTLAL
jgi:hypothetical protein